MQIRTKEAFFLGQRAPRVSPSVGATRPLYRARASRPLRSKSATHHLDRMLKRVVDTGDSAPRGAAYAVGAPPSVTVLALVTAPASEVVFEAAMAAEPSFASSLSCAFFFTINGQCGGSEVGVRRGVCKTLSHAEDTS